MGAEESQLSDELCDQLGSLCDELEADYDVLNLLATHFQQVYGDQMTRDQFVEACGFGGCRDALAGRIFDSLPNQGQPLGVIDFLRAIFTLSGNGDPTLRARIIFNLYDNNGDGILDEDDLRTVTAELLADMRDDLTAFDFDALIDEAVKSTFISADKSSIDFDLFLEMAKVNPWLLSPVQLDLQRLIDYYQARVQE